MKTLGYLGLGVMGYGMTGNLIDKSGCDIYGYDPVPALRERFAARGGKVLDDAKTLYKTCDIIFMCLPTNAIVKATITEIMETARPGTTIVDMGSRIGDSVADEIRALDGVLRVRVLNH
mgnify:CR=1 FL=1